MRVLLALMFMAISAGLAVAQSFPSSRIRMIVPYPAGSNSDVVARKFSERLWKIWNQPVVIENITGSGGNLGASAAAKAAPDGYTLFVVAHPILTTNQWLYAQMPFDPEHDFIPVIRLTASPNILLVNSAVPAKTVGQLIELARSKPDSLSYGSGGIGTGPFIAAELLKKIANIDLLHVPYRGSAPAALGLMGGEVQILFDAASTATSHIQTGKVRALATGGRQRIAVLPDVPTMAESGFPDFESVLVTSVVVPAGTPEAIVSKLNADFNTVLSDSEVKTYFNKIGSDVVGGTPQELADFLRTDRAKMGELIKSQGITVK